MRSTPVACIYTMMRCVYVRQHVYCSKSIQAERQRDGDDDDDDDDDASWPGSMSLNSAILQLQYKKCVSQPHS